MPKYMEIYREIRLRIESGNYAPDKKLPEGSKLASEFSCSELTITKALDLLVREGLVLRKRGSGSFVKRLASSASNSHLSGTAERCARAGKKLETRVINFTAEPADEHVAQKLTIPRGQLVYVIHRVRVIDGVPSIIEYTWMPVDLIPQLTLTYVNQSIYHYITRQLGWVIHSAHMTITGQQATHHECQQLALVEPTALIQVEQVAFLDNGKLFEYSIARHLWDSFNFETDFVRV
ncbi:GntR family transcriptional regulator [Erwinia oleae]|uniref:GntR family transcriptional regulator n=1 Tax=Erwinia oleae TaxID=796334 RepID=UPI0005540AE7|nr:GntR family transcriptional regulator [Erwinia oleae]